MKRRGKGLRGGRGEEEQNKICKEYKSMLNCSSEGKNVKRAVLNSAVTFSNLPLYMGH